eukprot:TRINITY_DN65488_c0_g1_i1.p1 TRINITY_DN65488_c0_g1~~TRINITY_DN65488_c0_g1_i1.p1  ORF type:complete len:510 (+),score=118.08 TRINITY_DN65488_c0_g1_i1:71-1531(+)
MGFAQRSPGPRGGGRGPQPRIQLLVLLVVCAAVGLFAVHGAALGLTMAQTPRTPAPPPLQGSVETDALPPPQPLPLHSPSARQEKPAASSAVSVQTPSTEQHPRVPLRRFRKLWPPAAWPRAEGGATERPVRPLEYDNARTADPRGTPLPRHAEQAKVDETTGRILTADRRRTRQPLIIPAVQHQDLAEHQGERAREWNIVMGIPSIDTDTGARRRDFQRASWMQYSNVWHGDNPSATVLVKYLLAYHPANDYKLRSSLLAEGRQHKDIIAFDMREGDPKPPPGWKKDKKPWPVEVGMSRKAYAWYCYVVDTYRANWVIKGDDDEFMRTKLLELELNSLPFTERVYYGRVMYWGVAKGSSLKFPFSGGMSITMTFDLADWIRDSQYAEEGKEYYHEDVMVGRWFFAARVAVNVVRDCRHHDVHKGANKQPIKADSLCIHHLGDSKDEYVGLFRRFPDDRISATPPRRISQDALGNRLLELKGGCKK